MKYYSILIFFFFAACLPNKGTLNFSVKPTLNPIERESAEALQKLRITILDPHKCSKCHKGEEGEKKMLSSIIPGNADDSKFFKVLVDGSMPKNAPPLSTLELEYVRQYIENLKVR